MRRRADAVLRVVENALAAVGLAALVVMMFVIAADVAMRYMFRAPLSWSVGFVSAYALIALFFLGLPYTVREGAHVRIDLLFTRLPERARAVLSVGALVVSALFVIVLAYGGWNLTAKAIQHADVPMPGSSTLSWPVWTSTIMVPLGAALTVLRIVLTLVSDPTESTTSPAGPPSASREPETC